LSRQPSQTVKHDDVPARARLEEGRYTPGIVCVLTGHAGSVMARGLGVTKLNRECYQELLL